jgi:hypothetical protein
MFANKKPAGVRGGRGSKSLVQRDASVTRRGDGAKDDGDALAWKQ